MEMAKISEKPKKRPVKLWTYLRFFSPPMIVPMKFSEWNIIPSPVMNRMRQEIASVQWTIRSKASVACIIPGFMVIHPLPSCLPRPRLIGELGPVDHVVQERAHQDASRRKEARPA